MAHKNHQNDLTNEAPAVAQGEVVPTATEGQVYTLEQAAEFVKLTPFRVRMAIRAGDLKSHLEPRAEGVKTLRHMITYTDLMAWRSVTGTHSKREDGRTKFVIYMTTDEQAQVEAILKEHSLVLPIARANVKKVTAE
jgi:hypothetical protein